MGTGLEISLIIASIRCVIQLTMMVGSKQWRNSKQLESNLALYTPQGYVLDDVLASDNAGVVILMSCK